MQKSKPLVDLLKYVLNAETHVNPGIRGEKVRSFYRYPAPVHTQ